jgi:hypothetical protein
MRAGWCGVRSMKMINLLWAVVIAMLSACEKEQVVTEKEQAVMKTSKSDVNTTVDSSTFSGHIENEEDIDFEQEHKSTRGHMRGQMIIVLMPSIHQMRDGLCVKNRTKNTGGYIVASMTDRKRYFTSKPSNTRINLLLDWR